MPDALARRHPAGAVRDSPTVIRATSAVCVLQRGDGHEPAPANRRDRRHRDLRRGSGGRRASHGAGGSTPPPPTITINSPVRGAGTTTLNAAITGAYACGDEAGGSAIATCAAAGPVDTSTPGPKTYTVNAADNANNHATKTVNYTVDPDTTPPTITITSPVDNQHYAYGSTIAATYNCDDPGGSGVATCIAATAIDTTVGTHAYTVNATDNASNAASKTIHYTVDPDTTPPVITITHRSKVSITRSTSRWRVRTRVTTRAAAGSRRAPPPRP